MIRFHGGLAVAWFVFCTMVALGFMSFLGWLLYVLVMHFTHGGTS